MKLIIMAIFFVSNVFASDCLKDMRERPGYTINCTKPRSCTDIENNHSGEVMFVDANFSHCEVYAAKCSALSSCKKFTVIPRIETSRESREALRQAGLTGRCVSSNPYRVRKCMRDILDEEGTTSPKFQKLLEHVVPSEDLKTESNNILNIDYLKRITEITEGMDIDKENNAIFSGHSGGRSVFGGDISISFQDAELAIQSNREKLKSTFFCACSTGGPSALTRELNLVGPIPPGRIYGFDGTAPGNSAYSAKGLSQLMSLDSKLARQADTSSFLSELNRLIHRSNNPVVLHCSAENNLEIVARQGSTNFDPDAEGCSLEQRPMRNCMRAIWTGTHPEACNNDIWPRYRDYSKGVSGIGTNPLKNYLTSFDGDIKDLDDKTKKLFKLLYRISQATSHDCLQEATEYKIEDPINLYNISMYSVAKENILNYFQPLLSTGNEVGSYNKIIADYNQNHDPDLPLITDETFSSRTNINAFFQMLMSNGENLLPWDIEKDTAPKIIEASNVRSSLMTITHSYLLQGNYSCSNNKFKYSHEYNLNNTSLEQINQNFRNADPGELDCLKDELF